MKMAFLTQQAIRKKPCIIVDGARTLSVFLSAIVYPNYGYAGYSKHGKSVSELHPLSVSGKGLHRSLTSFPPSETRGTQCNIQTNEDKELGDCKSDQEKKSVPPPAEVEPDPFHFHSTCKTETIASVSSSFKLVNDFVTNAEEELLMKELEPHLKRLKYEFNHWDDAIHGFREVERSRWSTGASSILDRARQAAFPDPCKKLPQTHVLDLDKAGVIKPHVDSVRFCGNVICGLCLLSDAVMRLRHVDLKDQVVDVLLRRGSFYIMRDETRYNFTHEVLGEEESFFRGVTVVRGRRVSIMSRNQPSKPSPDDGPFIA